MILQNMSPQWESSNALHIIVQQDVAEAYNVEAMPTFLFIKGGEKVDSVVGGRKDDIHTKIVALMGSASA